jgi:hypothetical protein
MLEPKVPGVPHRVAPGVEAKTDLEAEARGQPGEPPETHISIRASLESRDLTGRDAHRQAEFAAAESERTTCRDELSPRLGHRGLLTGDGAIEAAFTDAHGRIIADGDAPGLTWPCGANVGRATPQRGAW